eukprot:363466-Chlamydomonas_euryale.AAC.11
MGPRSGLCASLSSSSLTTSTRQLRVDNVISERPSAWASSYGLGLIALVRSAEGVPSYAYALCLSHVRHSRLPPPSPSHPPAVVLVQPSLHVPAHHRPRATAHSRSSSSGGSSGSSGRS